MDYKITVLTVSQAIPRGTSNADAYEPWFRRSGQLAMPDAQVTTITVQDSDAQLDNIFASKTYGGVIETEQRLTAPATFGYGSTQTTLAAGTQLSFSYGSIIQDSEGNQFIVTFPNTGTTSVNGTVIGGYHSVIVMPLPKTTSTGAVMTDPAGQPIYPVFDPAKSYTYVTKRSFGSKNYGIDYSYGEAIVDCFAEGTMIDTAFGPRAVETLAEGDMIRTRDNGMRWLSWIGHVHVDAARLDLQPNLRPIRIAAGALAPGVPESDLTVSPQHRVLIRSAIAQRMFDEPEILVAAKHLVGLPGIEVVNPPEGVTYWHILFDGHEVVRSNGAWTESLFLGPEAMKGMDAAGRREIQALFPDLAEGMVTPRSARRLLTGREGRKLAERHDRNRRQLVESA